MVNGSMSFFKFTIAPKLACLDIYQFNFAQNAKNLSTTL